MGALLVREDAVLHAGKELGQVEPVDVLHDQVRIGAVGLKVVDRHDVGMGEKAGRAGLGQGFVGSGGGGAAHIIAG